MFNMAPCGGLQQIFENPPAENPSLIESLSSWKPIRSVKSIDHSYTELFGELHFKENPETQLPSALVSEAAASWSFGSALLSDQTHEKKNDEITQLNCYSTKKCDSHYSMMNTESLQLCTEGLGFESLDGVEDMKNETNIVLNNNVFCSDEAFVRGGSTSCVGSNQYKIAKSCGSKCPPPISSVGIKGKTWVCFKSYRVDGRFVLEEVRTHTQEFLHASREDGRLRLCLVQHNDCEDGLLGEEEEEKEEDEDEDGGNKGNEEEKGDHCE